MALPGFIQRKCGAASRWCPAGSWPCTLLLLGGLAVPAACNPSPGESGWHLAHTPFGGHEPVGGPQPPGASFPVPAPPLSDGVFPCSDCHDPEFLPPDRERRELSMAHTEIVLEHDAGNRWCLDCHDAEDRDQLHLASGKTLPFEESHRLCGQCHGDKFRDWRAGVHGRRTGNWNGEKQYLLCVHCHSAHSPGIKPIEPKPVPMAPRRTP